MKKGFVSFLVSVGKALVFRNVVFPGGPVLFVLAFFRSALGTVGKKPYEYHDRSHYDAGYDEPLHERSPLDEAALGLDLVLDGRDLGARIEIQEHLLDHGHLLVHLDVVLRLAVL